MFYSLKYFFVLLLFTTCDSTYPEDLRTVVSHGQDVYIGLHIYSENSETIPIVTTTVSLYNTISQVDSTTDIEDYLDDFSDLLYELYSKKEAMLLVNENQYNKLLNYEVKGNFTFNKNTILSQISNNGIINEDYFKEDMNELIFYIAKKEILMYNTGGGVTINKVLIEELE